ncbi:TPA: excinuclease ABC subunit UvrC [Candidatus Poribacteria bacterium]|nr:excinuclease ABC subunit UvrC [Candidatus Poribacteria bacterium]
MESRLKNQHLEKKLSNIPASPGVYLMKDAEGRVIYAGKAVNLRNRVRSYFQASKTPHALTGEALRRVQDIDYIITDTEVEALILENTLIKKYKPRYNVKLKDDKRYLFVKVTVNEPFPGLYITRIVKRDGAKYFGPFARNSATRQTVKQLTKIFPIRACNLQLKESGNRHKVCLNYSIERCPGPCEDLADKEEYDQIVKNVCLFLGGKKELVIKELQKEMQTAAEKLQFERAAKIRDRIEAIEKTVEKQKLDSPDGDDEDVIGFAQKDDLPAAPSAAQTGEACVQVLMLRDGKLTGREHYFLTGTQDATTSDILTAFLEQYYLESSFVPKTVILQDAVENPEAIQKWLSEKRGSNVSIHVPQKGQKRQLVEMAAKNAKSILKQKELNVVLKAGDNPSLLELQEILELPRQPQRIEAFDISNLGSDFAVGSMVVFEKGEPAKSEYRRFRIRTVEGQDDFAMMREVVMRRYFRAVEENAILPDLILIDGGKGQLNSAVDALKALNLDNLPTIGLAKQFEHIFVPDKSEPIILQKNNPALHLIQRVRDEAHRFAINYHRKLRSKDLTHSVLDEIPGIGPKRKEALLSHFGSIEKIQKASLDKLLAVKGMTHRIAERILKHLVTKG